MSKKISYDEKIGAILEYINKDQKISENTISRGKRIGNSEFKKNLVNDYRKGLFEIPPDEIIRLRKNGYPFVKEEELESIESEYGISPTNVRIILSKYGTIEEFMGQFKRRNCELNFYGDIFVGARCIALSKNDMTVTIKRNYYELYRACTSEEIGMEQLLDIDTLEDAISELPKDEQTYIRLRYGLNDGILRTTMKAGSDSGRLLAESRDIEKTVLKKMRQLFTKKNVVLELETDENVNRIANKESALLNFEKLLMYLISHSYEDAKKADWQSLEIRMNEGLKLKIRTIRNTKKYSELIEKLENQYYNCLREVIRRKQMLERSKDRKKEIQIMYEAVENEYLNDEKIFKPEYIIKGIEVEKPELPEPASCIFEFPIPIETMALLHQAGVNTIEDLTNKARTPEKLYEYLNTIEGLDEDNKRRVIRYVYFEENRSGQNNQITDLQQELPRYINIVDMKDVFSPREITILTENGVYTLAQLLERTKNNLKDIQNIGEKTAIDISRKIQQLGYRLKFERRKSPRQKNTAYLSLLKETYYNQRRAADARKDLEELRQRRTRRQ